MAKQKTWLLFWLGFGEKEQKKQNRKPKNNKAVEEQSQPETPVETAMVVEAEEHAHSKEETESLLKRWLRSPNRFRRAKSQNLFVEAVTEAPQAVIEHEELPLPEEVKSRRRF